MTVPRFTIVIAAHNPLPRIEAAVRSGLGQSVQGLEVLVVDDGSEVPIDLGVLARDPRVRIVRHESNQGYGAVTATAVAEAAGDWLVWLDSDDVLHPDYCRTMHAAAARWGAQAVIGRLQHVDEAGTVRPMHWQPPGEWSTGREAVAAVLREEVPRGQHAMFSRELLTEPPAVENVYGDLVFMVRNIVRADVVAFVPEPFYDYFVHSASITGSLRESVWDIAGLPALLAPTLGENFPRPIADDLLRRARLLSLTMMLHTAAREPRDTPLRREVLAWCRAAITAGEVSAAIRDRRWTHAGSLALARVAPTLHRKLYRMYTTRKALSA